MDKLEREVIMPNWCHNHGEIVTDSWDTATKIIEHTTAGTLLNWIKPMPDGYIDSNKWYDWALNNWGTKWDVCDGWASARKEGNEYAVDISFSTAWSPPEYALMTLWERDDISRINIYYEEPGMAFKGYWVDGYDKPEEWKTGHCDQCETEMLIDDDGTCHCCGLEIKEVVAS